MGFETIGFLLFSSNQFVCALHQTTSKPASKPPSQSASARCNFLISLTSLAREFRWKLQAVAVQHPSIEWALVDGCSYRVDIGSSSFNAESDCLFTLHTRDSFSLWYWMGLFISLCVDGRQEMRPRLSPLPQTELSRSPSLPIETECTASTYAKNSKWAKRVKLRGSIGFCGFMNWEWNYRGNSGAPDEVGWWWSFQQMHRFVAHKLKPPPQLLFAKWSSVDDKWEVQW